jgi:hypothetical protein
MLPARNKLASALPVAAAAAAPFAASLVIAPPVRSLNTPVSPPKYPPTNGEREGMEKVPVQPPTEEQLPGGVDASDLHDVGTDILRGMVHAAVKSGQAGDVVR